MKTLIIILTTTVLLSSCGNKNNVYECESKPTSTNESECICKLIAKKDLAVKEALRKKSLQVIRPKIVMAY